MKHSRWGLFGAVVLVTVAVGVSAARQSNGDGQEADQRRVYAGPHIGGMSERASLGVTVRDLDEAELAASPLGVIVERVREDGPAATSGVRPGDRLIQFDGLDVRSVRQLVRLVAETPVGRSVSIAIGRDGRREDLEVVLADSAPRGFGALRNFGERLDFTLPGIEIPDVDVDVRFRAARLGVGVQALRPQLAEYFGVSAGVLVAEVRDDSPAARAGISAGDVITSVNGASVESGRDLDRHVRRAEPGAMVLEVTRDRQSRTVEVDIATPSPSRTPAGPGH